jgi:hypothetical protein
MDTSSKFVEAKGRHAQRSPAVGAGGHTNIDSLLAMLQSLPEAEGMAAEKVLGGFIAAAHRPLLRDSKPDTGIRLGWTLDALSIARIRATAIKAV